MVEMLSKPKPCPHCGSEDLKFSSYDVGGRIVRCSVCGLRGPTCSDHCDAAEQWNKLPRRGDEWHAEVQYPDGTSRPFKLADLDKAIAICGTANEPEKAANEPGMSRAKRRDHFASIAMHALLKRGDEYSETGSFPDGLAEDAVRVADALIRELDEEEE